MCVRMCIYMCVVKININPIPILNSLYLIPISTEMEASVHSGGEEESELSMLIGTPQTTYPPGSQGLEDSQSSVEFDSLYQSGGLEGAGQFHLVFSFPLLSSVLTTTSPQHNTFRAVFRKQC